MASEYWKWKFRDVKPDAPRVLTPKERRANWCDYHKWHVLLGAVLLLALADLIYHAAGIGQVTPDCQFAYIGSRVLPEEAVSAFEAGMAELCQDANGDGRVAVRLNQYAAGEDANDPDAALMSYAANVRLMADLERGDSSFFLLEDPARFQRDYEILSDDAPVLWADCPALASLPLGEYAETLAGETVRGEIQPLFAGVYLARRPDGRAADGELWEVLTLGASS